MKPRLRPLAGRAWEVDFGSGRTARLRQSWDMRAAAWTSDYHWDSYRGDERLGTGLRASLDEAFVDAWIAVAEPPAPLGWDRIRVATVAQVCERGDAPHVATVLRQLLRERTGLVWSARAGRGRERFHVRVTAPKGRLVNGALTAADRVLLSSIFGVRVGRDGLLVEPHHGCRSAAVWRAAGLEQGAVAAGEHAHEKK